MTLTNGVSVDNPTISPVKPTVRQVAVQPVKPGDTAHFKVIKAHIETETTLPKLQIKRMLKENGEMDGVLSQTQKDSALTISPQTRTERIKLYPILQTHQSTNQTAWS